VAAVIGTQAAPAQTAASLVVVAGNGQLTCPACTTSTVKFFLPMVVKVLDANGLPIPNKTVNWTLVSSQGPLPSFGGQSFTDGTGVASTFFNQAFQPGSQAARFLQSVVQASADGATVNFTETMALTDPNANNIPLVFAKLQAPDQGVVLSGTAGAPATIPIKVHVDGSAGGPIQGVSVRLLNANDPASGATANCATGAFADVNAVLTDVNGDASCTPVFGPISGAGSFSVLVGGFDPAESTNLNLSVPVAYYQSFVIPISVQAGVPGQVSVVSGNNQTINAGQASQPLVLKVTDASGTNPIAGQTVAWSVSPAGAATPNPASSVTDSSGTASTVINLSSTAVGTITIKGGLTGSASNLLTTFVINVNVQLTGLDKVSGDSQSAPAGKAFGAPLVVQVNASNGKPAPGVAVSFSITGPGALSANTVNSDSSGRASVTVTAGSTQGTITVTATTGAFKQTFTLTVIPPGPSLSTGAFLNGADFQRNAISPCSVTTIQATGLAPNVQGVVIPGTLIGPLPYTLAGDQVTVGGSQSPIYSVSNINGREQITIQIPCELTPGNNIPVTASVSGGSGTTNITVLPAAPGIFSTVYSDGITRAVLVRPDGSFVSLTNPARRGEIIRLYATGLGPTLPSVGTNSIAIPGGADALVTGQIIVGVANAGTRVISARVAPDLIGVYEVAFQVPSDAPTGNDIVLSLAVNVPGDSTTRFSAGNKITIQ
jgi:uncharacterized protein (TIGR03437 family)